MKKLSFILTLLIMLAASSCGSGDKDELFNADITRNLIKKYDDGGGKLTPEEYSALISQTHLLYADIKDNMKKLLDISEPLRFNQEYQRLKSDKTFIDKITIGEQVWRVLVLGQKGFSPENQREFGDLPDQRMLIDYYDDTIRTRLTAPADSI